MSYQNADGYYQQQPQGYYQQQPGYQAAPQYGSGGQTDAYGHLLAQQSATGSPLYGKNHQSVFVEGEPFYADCPDPELNRRFKTQGWQDVWAAVLFYIHLIAVIVVAIINIKDSKFSTEVSSSSSNTTNVDIHIGETAKTFGKAAGASLGISVGLTTLFLMLMKQFPSTFIYLAQGFVILIWVAYIALGFYLKATILIVFGIIFLLLSCLWLFMIRNQIPFSALLLEMSSGVVMRYPSTIVFGFVALFISIVYYIFWALMTVPTLAKFEDNQVNYQATGLLCFVFLILFYWTQALCQAIVHITTGGTIATYFFVGSEDKMPPNPTWASFKRAMTTSFGSAAFGSLIIGILRAMEAMARAAYRQNRNNIGACIALCFIQCIENLLQIFNEYAFSVIAATGQSYREAASTAWDMVMNGSIFTGIINNILVGRVIVMLSLFNALVCAIICYFAFEKSWVAAVAGVLVGLVVTLVSLHTVNSGVTTFIVCISMAPEVWVTKHPELAQKIAHAIKEMQKGCCDSDDNNQS